jgi:acetyl-CoA C-acetyltransferase
MKGKTMADPIVIVAARRTALGGFLGSLASLTAPQLGSAAIRAALEDSKIPAGDIDQVTMGCVLAAGLGQAPARQAALGAGLPQSVPASTINKVCGSGMKAVMDAHDLIAAGSANIVVAGGMESMSNAPFLLPKARIGLRVGHGTLIDHMFLDGLEDAYDQGRSMGTFAETCASVHKVSRAEQDCWAVRSLTRAKIAASDGTFAREIVPTAVKTRSGTTVVAIDEQPTTASAEKIPTLKPVFAAGGTITAASTSSISDGSAALVLTRASLAEAHGLKPIARILGHANHAQQPEWFSTAPIFAVDRLLKRLRMKTSDVGLFEVNEAFAVVPIVFARELGIDPDDINVFGGACALGHPLGASGARVIVTLLNALRQLDRTIGVAAVCIGGGEATAIAIERLSTH